MFGKTVKHAVLGATAAGALLCALSMPANAVSVTDQTINGVLGEKQWSDNSAETLTGPSTTVVQAGSILSGILQMSTVENLNPSGGGTRVFGSGGVNELTAMYSFTVVSTNNGAGGACTSGPGLCNIIFTSTAGFGSSPGSVAKFWEDTTPDFDRAGCATVAACTATATDGTPYLELGLTGANVFFTAQSTNGNDISLFPNGSVGGFFNGGLNILSNSTGMTFGKEACAGGPVDFCLNGTVAAPNAGVFDLWDDVNFLFTVTTPVPEPATLSLFGLGLLGLGALRRRRAKA